MTLVEQTQLTRNNAALALAVCIQWLFKDSPIAEFRISKYGHSYLTPGVEVTPTHPPPLKILFLPFCGVALHSPVSRTLPSVLVSQERKWPLACGAFLPVLLNSGNDFFIQCFTQIKRHLGLFKLSSPGSLVWGISPQSKRDWFLAPSPL